MTIAEWLTIIAIVTGPIAAVQITRYLDNKKEKRERQLSIFKTLMATRQYLISYEHVSALNKIDLEFDSNNAKERAVIEAWKAYLDLLNTRDMEQNQWNVKRVDLLVNLLHTMAQILDYQFDKTHIKNSSYMPGAHGDLEEQQKRLRYGLIDVLEGRKSIPMEVTNLPKNQSGGSPESDDDR